MNEAKVAEMVVGSKMARSVEGGGLSVVIQKVEVAVEKMKAIFRDLSTTLPVCDDREVQGSYKEMMVGLRNTLDEMRSFRMEGELFLHNADTGFLASSKVVASRPEKAYLFATEISKVRGVASVTVNDWAVVSSNPTVYDVDVLIYIDPMIGGAITNTLKAGVNRVSKQVGVRLKEFWSPRADRSVADIGWDGLRGFYARNPYKVSIFCTGEE